jgi:hypothetical protein
MIPLIRVARPRTCAPSDCERHLNFAFARFALRWGSLVSNIPRWVFCDGHESEAQTEGLGQDAGSARTRLHLSMQAFHLIGFLPDSYTLRH